MLDPIVLVSSEFASVQLKAAGPVREVHSRALSFASLDLLHHTTPSLRTYRPPSHNTTMASQRETSPATTTAAAALLQQITAGDEDMSWTQDLPAVEESAPGDALYGDLEAFVNGMSEGEDSSDGEDGEAEESQAGEDDDDNTGGGAATQAALAPTTAPPKRTRVDYTDEHKLVLYLLHERYDVKISSLAKIFNHVFRHEGHVRGQHPLEQRWFLWKSQMQTDFATLTPA